MKCVFVISPLRGSEEQFAEIDRKVAQSVAENWMDRDVESRALYIRLATLHYRRALLEANVATCKYLCLDLTLMGYAPFAPHLLYPLFLDDGDEFQRGAGIAMGQAWMKKSDEVWVYRKAGISSGMRHEIENAAGMGLSIITPPAWMP